MWGYEAEPGQFLYHYTTRQAALGSILPTGQIRFGLFAATNDPREAKDWLFALRVQGSPLAGDEFLQIAKDATRLAKETCKVLCLTMDDHSPREPHVPVFGRGFAHSRMWAQYAGGHGGVCLIFDWSRLNAAIEQTLGERGEVYSGAVQYTDYQPRDVDAFMLEHSEVKRDGLESVIDRQVQRHYDALFLSKTLEWSSEFEYRWILRNPIPSPEFVPIQGALRGICLGEDFPTSEHDALVYQCERLGVETTATLVWRNGLPGALPGPWRP